MSAENFDVMLDLETMGNGSRAAILAIGAVYFGASAATIAPADREFYIKVDLQSCLDAGLEMDASTVLWWLQQSDEARRVIACEEGVTLGEAIDRFSKFLGARDARVWGNGAVFDNAIMANAARALRLPWTWAFWNDRCYRTLRALRPDISAGEFLGVKHNALADAKFQAAHAEAILAAMASAPARSLFLKFEEIAAAAPFADAEWNRTLQEVCMAFAQRGGWSSNSHLS